MLGEIVIGVFVLAMAVLVPLMGADSRDGRDWQPRELALRHHRHDGE